MVQMKLISIKIVHSNDISFLCKEIMGKKNHLYRHVNHISSTSFKQKTVNKLET